MFTGIVEETGQIKAINNFGKETKLVIQANKILGGTNMGDSISVNGICLTVTEVQTDSFTADVMPETIRRSNLSQLKLRSKVNLERALRLNDRLGGHIVSGHIDGTGILLSVVQEQNAIILKIKADAELLKYMIEKGSVTLDGVSLTLINAGNNDFSVSIIPHSAAATIIGSYKPGDHINIECDLIGKYVERLLTFKNNNNPNDMKSGESKNSAINFNYLKEHGFY